MTFAKFEENRFRIDGEIAENHAILVNLTASIVGFTLASSHNFITYQMVQLLKYLSKHRDIFRVVTT